MPARSLDQIVSLSKRRGFVFPGSAAYGGLGSFWDYGPLGAELMRNVKDAWWKAMTWDRDDIEGVDCAILMNRKVWQHSGHEATFSDPLVDNKTTKKRYRADHLLEAQPDAVLEKLFLLYHKSQIETGKYTKEQALEWYPTREAKLALIRQAFCAAKDRFGIYNDLKVIDPATGAPGDWTAPRSFNLMFQTHVGPVEAAPGTEEELASRVYLRPETAQGI
ncbi:MAG TPA: hypothetical protein PLF37_07880, partial [Planctomycetota bacterium]|nr:hypothetical protein [Planctomycetota bacterium]